ncbi:MAG: ClpX C4-type zinc finger protein [Candidatus Rokuibacteriota bacterium]
MLAPGRSPRAFDGQMNVKGQLSMSAGPEAAMSCSFCKKSKAEVRYLVAGPGVHICDVCVAVSIDLIADWDRAKTDPPAASRKGVPPPARIHCDPAARL